MKLPIIVLLTCALNSSSSAVSHPAGHEPEGVSITLLQVLPYSSMKRVALRYYPEGKQLTVVALPEGGYSVRLVIGREAFRVAFPNVRKLEK